MVQKHCIFKLFLNYCEKKILPSTLFSKLYFLWNIHLWFAQRLNKEYRSVALLNDVLSRPSNQNRGRVWVSVERVWTCLNMFGFVDSRTIEQVFLSSGDAMRTIWDAMMSSISIVIRTIDQGCVASLKKLCWLLNRRWRQ